MVIVNYLLLVILKVWEGLNAVAAGRMMLGETNPVSVLPFCTNNCL